MHNIHTLKRPAQLCRQGVEQLRLSFLYKTILFVWTTLFAFCIPPDVLLPVLCFSCVCVFACVCCRCRCRSTIERTVEECSERAHVAKCRRSARLTLSSRTVVRWRCFFRLHIGSDSPCLVFLVYLFPSFPSFFRSNFNLLRFKFLFGCLKNFLPFFYLWNRI